MTRIAFVEHVVGSTDLSESDANRILDYYVQQRIASYNVHDGYTVKHGAFMEYDVLERASQASLLAGVSHV